MKKYFLMLVVALVMPLVFTSCGDDDPKTDEPSKFPYSLPVTNWGISQTSVKSAMANSGFTLDEKVSDATALLYSYNDNFPFYVYGFTNDQLDAASLTLSDAQDSQYDFQGFLENTYGKATDEDDEYWYYDAKTSIVAYGYSEAVDGWMATWIPNTKGDLSVVKEAAKANLELVKKARNQK